MYIHVHTVECSSHVYETTFTVEHFMYIEINVQNNLNSLKTQLSSSSIETIIAAYCQHRTQQTMMRFYSNCYIYRRIKNKSHFVLFFILFYVPLKSVGVRFGSPSLLISTHTTYCILICEHSTNRREISLIEILLLVQFFSIQ